MKEEITDRYFDIPMNEWIQHLPNELDYDIVGMWQVVPVGQDSFRLNGESLISFTKKCLVALLSNGGKFVVDKNASQNWQDIQKLQGDSEQIADRIIHEWQKLHREPDWYQFWFEKTDS